MSMKQDWAEVRFVNREPRWMSKETAKRLDEALAEGGAICLSPSVQEPAVPHHVLADRIARARAELATVEDREYHGHAKMLMGTLSRVRAILAGDPVSRRGESGG